MAATPGSAFTMTPGSTTLPSSSASSDWDAGGDDLVMIDLSVKLEVKELIGQGSFGLVRKGSFGGREVAVKQVTFTPGSADVAEAQRLLKSEIALLHGLSHPNVVQFVGASMRGDTWMIVMEYLEGGTLKNFLATQLARKKKLPLKKILALALDIARGMEYLHSKDIIHRDLKSPNVLLTAQGTAKVSDFGLARHTAHDPNDLTSHTGTIAWMSPEMIEDKPYTTKVDVYSFGIVLWEIATTKFPFPGYSYIQLAHAVSLDGVRPSTSGCAVELVGLMKRCWDADPDKRPTFTEIIADLESIEGGYRTGWQRTSRPSQDFDNGGQSFVAKKEEVSAPIQSPDGGGCCSIL